MLPRRQRLTRTEVAEVLTGGRRYGDQALSLRALLDTQPLPSRFAIVVPAKQVPLAVTRHQIKRRVRAILAKLTPELLPGLMLMVFCNKEVKNWPFAELKLKLTELLTKSKLVKVL